MDLTKENYHLIKEEKIYLWGALKTRIGQLFAEIGNVENIIAIVDNRIENSGSVLEINGRELNVISPVQLEKETDRYSVIVTCNHYQEILEQIKSTEKLAVMTQKVYNFITPSQFYTRQYREKYDNQPVEDIFLFYSGPTRRNYVPEWEFADNSRALFEYLLKNNYNEKYSLVWIVKHPEHYERYSKLKNVSFISIDWVDSPDECQREAYYHSIFSAKYIFMTEAFGFMHYAKPNQTRVQLWHGCGFKLRHSQSPHEGHYEFMTVISEFYKKIHAGLYGLRMDQVLVTGYPKDDWLFQPYEESVCDIFHMKPTKKCIFWLPTFRTAVSSVMHLNQYEINPQTGLPVLESKKLMDRLNDLLNNLDVNLIIKLHPAQEPSVVAKVDYSNILLLTQQELAEKDLVINRLLASADALISDYSSAAIDYLILDRPIGFTLDDKEEFNHTRGLVFDPIEYWLPGKKIYNFNNFCDFITEIANEIDSEREIRHKLLYIMHDFHDGNSCQRVLDALGITKS